ncbi:hypothetical protein MTO96_015185 [Rhipicephalus appendiculatus]
MAAAWDGEDERIESVPQGGSALIEFGTASTSFRRAPNCEFRASEQCERRNDLERVAAGLFRYGFGRRRSLRGEKTI